MTSLGGRWPINLRILPANDDADGLFHPPAVLVLPFALTCALAEGEVGRSSTRSGCCTPRPFSTLIELARFVPMESPVADGANVILSKPGDKRLPSSSSSPVESLGPTNSGLLGLLGCPGVGGGSPKICCSAFVRLGLPMRRSVSPLPRAGWSGPAWQTERSSASVRGLPARTSPHVTNTAIQRRMKPRTWSIVLAPIEIHSPAVKAQTSILHPSMPRHALRI